MSGTSRFRVIYFIYFSKPAFNRPIYRAIRRRKVCRIVELGIGTGKRAVRMIEVARLHTPAAKISYTGIDLFEDRFQSDGPGLSLKTAHRLLAATGARIQLVPGDPLTGLARTANNLGGTDLVVVSQQHDPDSLARAWFYLPRLLHPSSLVLLEHVQSDRGVRLQAATPLEIEQLAAGAAALRAA